MKLIFIPLRRILPELIREVGLLKGVWVILMIRHMAEIANVIYISQHKQYICGFVGNSGIRAVRNLSVGLIVPQMDKQNFIAA